MSKYNDVINKMQYHLQHKDEGYNMPLFPNYNKIVGNIVPGIFSVFGGTPSSGRSTFVDVNYVMNPMLQWFNLDEKKPLKIIYFSLTDSEFKKTQHLLCSYMMMVEGVRVDIPTLNSQKGRLYDIGDRPDVLNALTSAKVFFDDIEQEKVLDIVPGRKAPSEIYNYMLEILGEIGTDTQGEPYEYNSNFEGSTVILVIDSADELMPEYDGYGRTSKDDLGKKLTQYAEILSRRYKVNVNIIISTDRGFIRRETDTLPAPKHLGVYGKAHRGIILYNPIADGTENILIPSEKTTNYISNGINTLRFWYVVKNTDGADSQKDRLLMLPGAGYVLEFPYTGVNIVQAFTDVYNTLMGTTSPYI